ncbi:MAG: hypothetical protein MAG453_01457 [Calditrichaeota bacterium]|nr:hypothetical protein [Calditrichota bacterium]
MLAEILSELRSELIERWSDEILATYPRARIRFAREPDRFSDPLAHILRRDLPVLFEIAAGGVFDGDRLREALDPLCRLRSVQEFSASEAVQFVFLLKKVVREALTAADWSRAAARADVLAFETRVDRIALHAFDVYTACRETLHEIRTREAGRRSELIVRRFAEKGRRAFAEPVDPEQTGTQPPADNGHGGNEP